MPKAGVPGSHPTSQGSRWTWGRSCLGDPSWVVSFHTSNQRSSARHVWSQGLGWAPTQASNDLSLQPLGGGAAIEQGEIGPGSRV